ncbi:unnamed protein product [Rhodiola kirilowii]
MAICGISKRVLLSYLVPMISQVVPSSAVCSRSLNSKCDLLMPFESGWFQRSRYVHSSRMLFCVASQPIATVRPVGNKISRAAMAEARAVLFDYLQNTRSFQFSDADHMSRNSDRFLLDLLAKVDIKENVTKSLSRYLRFNPINEFEPFFESLGMTPNEYSAYLPRDLMFLSDNQVLLDNFHDLCNYGILRGKMGKIYAEAESIFRYDHGVLASKFRAYEEFGLNKSSLIKFFIFDPSLLAGDANTEFIDFLQRLNKIGLENDWLAGYVSAESSFNWARMSQTVEILDRLGYGGDNVAKLFRNEPGLLLENSGKVIQILIRQLTKLGFKKDDVVTLFLQDPKLMSKKCLKNLSHSMSFLFEIGMKLEDIAYVVQTHKHILSSDTPKRLRTVLGTLKVGGSALHEMIKKEPTILFVSSSILLDNFRDLCNYGIPHGKMGKIYAEAESIFRYDHGVLASKFRAYAEFGLCKSSLIKFFTCDPSLLVGDENTKFIGFLQRLNKIGLENDWLAGYVSAESSYNWATMSQTVEILDRLGYGGDNVAKLFRNEPGLLLENSGKVIQILIRQLTKLGFKKDDVVTLFLQDPKLMSKKCLKNLSHSMSFLFEIGMKLEDIAYVVQTHKHILSSDTPKRPRTVLGTLKVGESALREMIKKEPTILFVSSSILLDNFHDLCNYGIPRGKMGKIYAEAESIFRYDHGVLASKFRAYEEFGLCKSSLIKFFTCDPSLLAGDVNTKFIGFLQRLNKIGLENDWLAGYVSAESSYNWTTMSQTVEILDRLGYGGDNVAKLFRNEPGLLLENSGKVIQILIRQLTKLGFKKDDVVTLFLQDPKLMSKKRLKNLSHSMTFLFEIRMKLEDIAYVVQTHKHILSSNTPKRPRTVLVYLKVGESALREMIKKEPTILFVSSSTSCPEDYKAFSYSLQAPARYLEKATFLKLLGYIENSEDFVEAAKRFRGRGDLLQERFNCLVQAGLDSYRVADIIKRVPRILNNRKEVLEQKIHLLTNVIRYPLESLVSCPDYLCYDVKKISLRFSMYSWMRDRGVAKPAMSLSTILCCSEERFVKYFVDIHDHGQAVWEKLKESSQTA